MPVLRNLDLVLLALALVLFLVAGLPIVGWITAAAIWALWRGIGTWADRRAAASTSPRETVGLVAGAMIGRGWLLGLILLGVFLVTDDREVGLSAALTVLVVFTVHFTLKLMLRSADPQPPVTT